MPGKLSANQRAALQSALQAGAEPARVAHLFGISPLEVRRLAGSSRERVQALRTTARALNGVDRLRAEIAEDTSEEEWLADLKELARSIGWRPYHTRDSRRSDPGFPDLVLARDLRTVYSELKTERGTLSEEQRWWLDHYARRGEETFLWRPSDRPEVQEILLPRERPSRVFASAWKGYP